MLAFSLLCCKVLGIIMFPTTSIFFRRNSNFEYFKSHPRFGNLAKYYTSLPFKMSNESG